MFDARKTMYGTFAELIIEGDVVGEAVQFQANVDFTKVDVPMCGKMGKATKVVGYEGKGSMKVTKISSRMLKLIADNLKNNTETYFSIISKVGDKGNGYERVQIKDASFDGFHLADWESKKAIEETLNFTFTEFKILDTIK